jgi:hypothetical protein
MPKFKVGDILIYKARKDSCRVWYVKVCGIQTYNDFDNNGIIKYYGYWTQDKKEIIKCWEEKHYNKWGHVKENDPYGFVELYEKPTPKPYRIVEFMQNLKKEN